MELALIVVGWCGFRACSSSFVFLLGFCCFLYLLGAAVSGVVALSLLLVFLFVWLVLVGGVLFSCGACSGLVDGSVSFLLVFFLVCCVVFLFAWGRAIRPLLCWVFWLWPLYKVLDFKKKKKSLLTRFRWSSGLASQ